MQAALEVTARYCGRELEQYGQCVAAKPETWQRDCHHLKMSIARCTSSHPIIRQIRQACAEPFEAFEECLRQNEAAVGNCAEHVRRFLQCADQVQLPHSPSTVEVFSGGGEEASTLSSLSLFLPLQDGAKNTHLILVRIWHTSSVSSAAWNTV
uniref:Coiled-coil-helix-coiled-coil-helix domain containing 5 n=1 Tax=Equus asinus TaxID=9793 RepID=A0A8C4LA00_EQUAS